MYYFKKLVFKFFYGSEIQKVKIYKKSIMTKNQT